MNQQSIELSSLERRQAEEMKSMQRAALSDWELRYARAKLELKEKHYKVCKHIPIKLIKYASECNSY